MKPWDVFKVESESSENIQCLLILPNGKILLFGYEGHSFVTKKLDSFPEEMDTKPISRLSHLDGVNGRLNFAVTIIIKALKFAFSEE